MEALRNSVAVSHVALAQQTHKHVVEVLHAKFRLCHDQRVMYKDRDQMSDQMIGGARGQHNDRAWWAIRNTLLWPREQSHSQCRSRHTHTHLTV